MVDDGYLGILRRSLVELWPSMTRTACLRVLDQLVDVAARMYRVRLSTRPQYGSVLLSASGKLTTGPVLEETMWSSCVPRPFIPSVTDPARTVPTLSVTSTRSPSSPSHSRSSPHPDPSLPGQPASQPSSSPTSTSSRSTRAFRGSRLGVRRIRRLSTSLASSVAIFLTAQNHTGWLQPPNLVRWSTSSATRATTRRSRRGLRSS